MASTASESSLEIVPACPNRCMRHPFAYTYRSVVGRGSIDFWFFDTACKTRCGAYRCQMRGKYAQPRFEPVSPSDDSRGYRSRGIGHSCGCTHCMLAPSDRISPNIRITHNISPRPRADHTTTAASRTAPTSMPLRTFLERHTRQARSGSAR